MFEISDSYMLNAAIGSVVLHFASFFCSSDELNMTLPQTKNKNTVGNMTWELLSATVCFHISFMYSGNNIKV